MSQYKLVKIEEAFTWQLQRRPSRFRQHQLVLLQDRGPQARLCRPAFLYRRHPMACWEAAVPWLPDRIPGLMVGRLQVEISASNKEINVCIKVAEMVPQNRTQKKKSHRLEGKSEIVYRGAVIVVSHWNVRYRRSAIFEDCRRNRSHW